MAANKAQILKLAQSYMVKGQLDKAIVEWEKLLSESPNDGNIYNTIGDLYLKKKDTARSIESYMKAADVFHESGFDLKTIAVYKKILKINPKQHEVYLKLGDLNAERGLTGNAISDYLTLAKRYTEDKRLHDAIEVYRKIANLDPQNTNIRLKLAELSLKEGFQKEAIKEYFQLSEIYNELGKSKEAETVFRHILKIDPENAAAKAGIQGGAPAVTEGVAVEEEVLETVPPEAPETRAVQESPSGEADLEASAEADRPEAPDEEASRPIRSSPPAEPVAEASAPAVEAGAAHDEPDVIEEPVAEKSEVSGSEESIQSILESTIHPGETAGLGRKAESGEHSADLAVVNDLFVEAEVYVKYGLVDKAIEQLRKVISLSPEHLDAHIRLKETLEAENRRPEAAEACVSMAVLLKSGGDTEGYHRCLEEARELDPDNPRLKTQADLEKMLEGDSMQEMLSEESQPDAPPSEVGVAPEPSGVDATAEGVGESSLSELWDEEMQPSGEATASGDRVASGVKEDELPRSEGEPEQPDELVFEEPFEPSMPETDIEPSPLAASDEREISLEEELEQTFTSLIGSHGPSASERTSPEDTLSQVSASAGSPDEELRSVISRYHDEPDDASLQSGEDIETHYNLGIAYSEMGLVNDAIVEFKIASRSADRFVDAQSMLAACYRKKGKSAEALGALEKALSAPQCGEKEKRWLMYELASLHESENRLPEALRLYTAIYEKDPAFKDVGKRVEALRRNVDDPQAVVEPRRAGENKDEEDIANLIDTFFENSMSQDASKDQKNEKKKKSRISYL